MGAMAKPTLAFVAVRKQHHQPRLNAPLFLAGSYEVIYHYLKTIDAKKCDQTAKVTYSSEQW